ncbi:hypothetical protein IV203_027970 [Nitzschia inconspicua]|uniref:Retrotransposon gag domain-containing protein n=1 Tax=Nitzschia inconspicua TaxID=303405 RepID=A0A9K3LY07_9STRA|nr:hypothetical protein IV203_027970 [Nitzschia inconspicua]
MRAETVTDCSQIGHQETLQQGPMTDEGSISFLAAVNNDPLHGFHLNNYCVLRQEVASSIDEVGRFVQLTMDGLRSSSSDADKEAHDCIISTIANFSLQLVSGISKVCAERDNRNNSGDHLPPLLPLNCVEYFRETLCLVWKIKESDLGTNFQRQRWKTLMSSFCSRPVRSRLEADKTWTKLNGESEVMGLLRLVRSVLQTGPGKKPCHNAKTALDRFVSFKQNELDVREYYAQFKDRVEALEYLGGNIGSGDDLIKQFTGGKGPFEVGEEKWTAAKARACDEFLAIQFLDN